MIQPNDICGSLTVIRCLTEGPPSIRKWLCLCVCGEYHEARAQHLETGHTTRCAACARLARKVGVTLAHAKSLKSGNTKHPYYPLWQSAKQRCENERAKDYINYGGRGITMYSNWSRNFREWLNYIETILGPKPSLQHSIDRIDNEGNYEPGNLRWATATEQNNNQQKHYA